MVKRNISKNEKASPVYPLLALENTVVVPLIPQPVKIDSEEEIDFLEKCVASNNEIAIATVETQSGTDQKSILPIVVVCIVDRIFQMPGAPTLAFVRPVSRAKIEEFLPFDGFPKIKASLIDNILPPKRISINHKFMLERVEELFKNLLNYMPEPERDNAEKLIAENSSTKVLHVYAIIHIAPLSTEEKYSILECKTYLNLLETAAFALDKAEQRISLQAEIHQRTHQELSRQQKETFLRMHMKHIKEELGEEDEDNDITEFKIKASAKNWKEEVSQYFSKELRKLGRLNINNPEYSVQYAYLENFLELPWNNYKSTDIDLLKVKDILDRDHYGLEHVKERILEYMAVLKLRNDLKAPILCLYGPPGVGKTSIGKSIAEAIQREYARISLGGLHDEAEIRGHRRTYIGAMPGRVIQTLSKLEYGNPLMLLDEIDKVGKDYKGDPASALLEALDPEQNNSFHDNFVDFPYDLSKVLFIATANDLSTIPPALRDRMEVIEMPKYSIDEKKEIASRHLIQKVLTENGFDPQEVVFSDDAIYVIIKGFTKEAGVRQLKMQLSKIIRKLALLKAKGEKYPLVITPDLVKEFLNKKDLYHNRLGFQG